MTTIEKLREVRTRLIQIASGDYRACGVFAEDVAKDALTTLDRLIAEMEADGDKLSQTEQPTVSEDKAVEIMARAAYEEYYRNGGKDCVWENATSNERIIHSCEARAALRALRKAYPNGFRWMDEPEVG